jgi:hypothetical protein
MLNKVGLKKYILVNTNFDYDIIKSLFQRIIDSIIHWFLSIL